MQKIVELSRSSRSGSILVLALGCMLGHSVAHADLADVPQEVDQASGQFQTELPLSVPGYRGLEPRLKLVYGSNGGNGLLGVGWDLSGTSFIQRGRPRGSVPRYDATDVYFLDGQELIANTALGGTHATKYQSYQRIRFNSTNNTWTVWQKDGRRLTYEPSYQTPRGVYRWALSRVEDTLGNAVTYHYWTDGAEVYLSAIRYNGAEIQFFLEARPDALTYANGAGLVRMGYRLKTIDVRRGGNRVRTYQLVYGTSGSTGKSVLTTFRQYGRDATVDGAGNISGGTQLPPVRLEHTGATGGFGASEVALPVGTHMQNGGGSINQYRTVMGDFDGDGRMDVATVSASGNGAWATHIQLELSTGTGTNSVFWPASTPARLRSGGVPMADYEVIAGDFNGDGKTDIATVSGAAAGDFQRFVSVELSTGTGFTSQLWASAFPGHMANGNVAMSEYRVLSGDFDGDGRTDLAYVSATAGGSWNQWFGIDRSTGTGFTSQVWSTAAAGHMRNGGGAMRDYDVLPGDYDGDGRTDLAIVSATAGGSWREWMLVLLSRGNAFATEAWNTPTPGHMRNGGGGTDAYTTVPGDFNGDGKTDLATVSATAGGNWANWLSVNLSTGAAFQHATWNASLPRHMRNGGGATGDYAVVPMDADGDGRTDLVVMRNRETASSSGWYSWAAVELSRGEGFSSTTWNYPQSPYALSGNARFARVLFFGGDFDGTGKDGLSYVRQTWVQNASQPNQTVAARILSRGIQPDMVRRVVTSTGAEMAVQYGRSVEAPQSGLPVGVSLPLVRTLERYDGRSARQTTQFHYFQARWDADDRRYLGYRVARAVIDTRRGAYTETIFHQSRASLPGKPAEQSLRNGQGAIFERTTYHYQENAAPPYSSLLVEENAYEQELTNAPRRRRTTTEWDAYGNVLRLREYGDTTVNGDERTTVHGYAYNTTNYIVDKPYYQHIFAGIDGSAKLSDVITYYDGGSLGAAPTRGLVTRVAEWNDQTNTHTKVTSFTYDARGNLVSETDPLGNVTRTEYETTYHLYPIRITNALGHVTTIGWNLLFGLENSRTDPNGGVTNTNYDVFGRRTRQEIVGLQTTNFAYRNWGNPAQQHTEVSVVDGSTGGLWEREYVDGFGRTWMQTRKASNATQGDRIKEFEYWDATSRVWKEGLPRYASNTNQAWRTSTYDPMGRLVRMQHAAPDTSEARREYGVGWERQINELGVVKTTWKDAYGRPWTIQETNNAAFTTRYQFDMLGRLRTVTNTKGQQTQISYNSLGHRLRVVDPDMGTMTFVHNAAGLLTERTDARGVKVTFQYDALGRLVSDSTGHRWGFDASTTTNGRGRLTSRTFPNGTHVVNAYDHRGNVLRETFTIDNVSRQFQYAYDGVGRLRTLRYPDTDAVTYGYDAGGELVSLSNYVNAMTYDPAGRLLTATFPNGVTERFTYNRSRETLLTAEVSNANSTLYQASYTYDAATRVTAMRSTTHSLSNLDYQYDALNRLTRVSGGQTQSLSYDTNGNILSNSLLGNYTYGDAAHPHAVTSVQNRGNYQYNASGLMTSGPGRTYAWNAHHRLTAVNVGSYEVRFGYDNEGQRVKRSSAQGTTLYFGKHIERENGVDTKFIFAGPRLVAKRLSNGNRQWFHQDRLGSVRVMTNGQGQRVKSQDYEAFGERIENTGTAANDRDFGGHFRDDETGLVYMGARYYDAKIGRFISPDNFVADIEHRESGQALNRYTYAMNNPVERVDPTGNFSFRSSFNFSSVFGSSLGGGSVTFGISRVSFSSLYTASASFRGNPAIRAFTTPGLQSSVSWSFAPGRLTAMTSVPAVSLEKSLTTPTAPPTLVAGPPTVPEQLRSVLETIYSTNEANLRALFGNDVTIRHGLAISQQHGIDNASWGRTERWFYNESGNLRRGTDSFGAALGPARGSISARGLLNQFTVGIGASGSLGPVGAGVSIEVGVRAQDRAGFLRISQQGSIAVKIPGAIDGKGSMQAFSQVECSGGGCLASLNRAVERLAFPWGNPFEGLFRR